MNDAAAFTACHGYKVELRPNAKEPLERRLARVDRRKDNRKFFAV
jgi:hypothetical protein